MSDAGWNQATSPFHEGELAIQERLGVRDRIDRQGRRMIRDYLTLQHQQFFAQLPYVLVGGLDESGHLWTSMLTGPAGFLSTPDEKILQVSTSLFLDDPLTQTIQEGSNVGLLGIELATRRRNRINGVVDRLFEGGFDVSVTQSFGNCPQYIQARDIQQQHLLQKSQQTDLSLEDLALNCDGSAFSEFEVLSEEDVALISMSDTFFISTAYISDRAGLASGVDVSHRGGKPGFVRVDENKVLTIPDFSGNNHFNTFGNLVMNPRAGLLFVDFERGDLLHLTGKAEVVWQGAEVDRYEGAERLFRFCLERGCRNNGRLGLRWSLPEFSPFLEKTGTWAESC